MAKHRTYTIRRHWDIDGDHYTVYSPDNEITYQSKKRTKAQAYADRRNKHTH